MTTNFPPPTIVPLGMGWVVVVRADGAVFRVGTPYRDRRRAELAVALFRAAL